MEIKSKVNVPESVAIILDGNGRWAKAHHVPKNMGHYQGAKTVEIICEEAYKLGIKYLTVYAFSSENWSRPKDEVDALMKLLRNYMSNCIEISRKNNMRVRIIGDITRLDADLQESIKKLEKESESNTGLYFLVAINYGGRDEITRTVRKIAQKTKEGEINVEDINEVMIKSLLDTYDVPDPDLIIRTSGEQRLSNFLLWQASYSEFYYTNVLWPDFNKEELIKAIEYYNTKERRYGGRNDEQ